MIWICISAGHGISHLVKVYSFKNWPSEKLWGWGQGIFEVHEISLVWIFLGVLCPPPPTPPNQFSKVPSLNYEYAQNFHLGNLCKWWAPLIHQCKLCNTCQAFEREMKRNFLTTNKLCNNYRLQLLLFTCIRGLLIIQSALSWRTPPMLTDTSMLTNISVYRPLRVGPLPFLIPFIWLYIRRTSLEAGHLVVVPLGHPTTVSP